MTGIVKSYNTARGFGLIEPMIGKPDSAALVFFHCSAIVGHRRGEEGGIPTGAEVEFDLCRGDRGPQAANVRRRVLKGSVLQGPFCGRVESALLPASVEQTARESVALPSRPHRPPAHQSLEPRERIA
jgi:cold shock CspA family protein